MRNPLVRARVDALAGAGTLDLSEPGVARGDEEDAAHGVLIRFFVRVAVDDRVVEARYQVFGCATSIACASLLAEQIPGLTLREVERIDPLSILRALSLDPDQVYAARTAVAALRSAVARAQGNKPR